MLMVMESHKSLKNPINFYEKCNKILTKIPIQSVFPDVSAVRGKERKRGSAGREREPVDD